MSFKRDNVILDNNFKENTPLTHPRPCLGQETTNFLSL